MERDPPRELPKDWRWVKSHLVCRFVRGHSTSELELNNIGEGVRYLRTSDLLGDLSFQKFDDRYCANPPPDAVMKEENEIVLTIEGWSGSERDSTVGLPCWQGEGILNNHVVKFVPKSPILTKRFAEYAHSSAAVCGLVQSAAVGAIAVSAGPALREVSIPLPPVVEQRTIANFLDRETARIDGLIAKKHALARSLIERFQVTLAHAFLSVRASLAAEERPLRWVAEVLLGRQRAPEHDQGPHMVRYLRAANVKDGELDLSDVKEMNFTPAEQRIFALARGDVLVSEGAGSLAAVGATAVWNAELAGTICFQNTLLRIRPRGDVDARFLGWWSRHAFSSGLFAAVAGGANIYHLGAQRVRGLPIAVPPIDTQRATVDRLDREEAQAHRAIQSLEAQLALLAERRQALITSAVSGLVELDGLREVDHRLG